MERHFAMFDPKIQDAFNKHLNAEMYSSYLYLSMAGYFEAQNLKGMAGWMRKQALEELQHAMKFFDFINERGGEVKLTAVEGPKVEWNSPLDVFQDTYDHECEISGLINNLVSLSIREEDYAASTFLQWFVTEQVEEEAAAQEIRDKLKLASDSAVALFMMDDQLGNRAGSTPAAEDA
jgi:ferritin